MTIPRCTNWHFYRVRCLLFAVVVVTFNNDNGIQIHNWFQTICVWFPRFAFIYADFFSLNSISGLKRFCLGALESNEEKQDITLNFVFFRFASHSSVCEYWCLRFVCFFFKFVFTCVIMPKKCESKTLRISNEQKKTDKTVLAIHL